jgi:hypothetical protein
MVKKGEACLPLFSKSSELQSTHNTATLFERFCNFRNGPAIPESGKRVCQQNFKMQFG